MMERRDCTKAPELEKRQDGSLAIRGYAAVFYDGTPDTEFRLWDGALERIMPGAFDRVVRGSDDVLLLRDHDTSKLLARRSAGNLDLASDGRGLRYEGTLPDTTASRDTVEDLRAGNLRGSSFAFRVVDEEWRQVDGQSIRELRDLEIADVGPVANPAYSGTSAEARSDDARASFEQWTAQRARAAREERASRIAAANPGVV